MGVSRRPLAMAIKPRLLWCGEAQGRGRTFGSIAALDMGSALRQGSCVGLPLKSARDVNQPSGRSRIYLPPPRGEGGSLPNVPET